MPIALIDKVQPFIIAIALGFLIGIERERSHPPGFQPMGARSFVLLGLLGSIAAVIDNIYIALAITVFVAAAVIAGYIRSSSTDHSEPDVGITTEIAAVVTYILGYLAFSEPFLSLILGVVVLITLLARAKIHKFSRDQLTTEEMTATAVLLAISVGIIPFLPDRAIDPWGLFNPRAFGWLVLIIALIQFAAYVGIRVFGRIQGLILSGFLAGFVSSTAATVTLLHKAKKSRRSDKLISIAILFATLAMLLEILVICVIISPTLAKLMLIPIVPSIVVALLLFVSARKSLEHKEQTYPAPENPLSLGAALTLAVILFAFLILVSLMQIYLGNEAFYFISFLSGLIQTRGTVLASANLLLQKKISLLAAINGISLVVLASFIAKYIIVWFIRRDKIAWYATLYLTLVLLAYLCGWGLIWFDKTLV
ncbi:MAG: MgtC/SapB family protein [Pseudomonadota bacterium]